MPLSKATLVLLWLAVVPSGLCYCSLFPSVHLCTAYVHTRTPKTSLQTHKPLGFPLLSLPVHKMGTGTIFLTFLRYISFHLRAALDVQSSLVHLENVSEGKWADLRDDLPWSLHLQICLLSSKILYLTQRSVLVPSEGLVIPERFVCLKFLKKSLKIGLIVSLSWTNSVI